MATALCTAPLAEIESLALVADMPRGFLAALPAAKATSTLAALHAKGITAARIGAASPAPAAPRTTLHRLTQ